MSIVTDCFYQQLYQLIFDKFHLTIGEGKDRSQVMQGAFEEFIKMWKKNSMEVQEKEMLKF